MYFGILQLNTNLLQYRNFNWQILKAVLDLRYHIHRSDTCGFWLELKFIRRSQVSKGISWDPEMVIWTAGCEANQICRRIDRISNHVHMAWLFESYISKWPVESKFRSTWVIRIYRSVKSFWDEPIATVLQYKNWTKYLIYLKGTYTTD